MSKGIQRKNSLPAGNAAMRACTVLPAKVSTSSILTPDDCYPRKQGDLLQDRTLPNDDNLGAAGRCVTAMARAT
jgi:hypothetical protein